MFIMGIALGLARVKLYVVAFASLAGLLLGFAWAEARFNDVLLATFDFGGAVDNWTISILRLSATLVVGALLARVLLRARRDRVAA